MQHGDLIPLAQQSLPRVTAAGKSQVENGTYLRVHHLKAPEINLITHGTARGTLNGQVAIRAAGYVYSYQSGDEYIGGTVEGGLYVCRWIRFEWPEWSANGNSSLQIPRELKLSAEGLHEIQSICDAIIDHFALSRPGWELSTAGQLLALVGAMRRETARAAALSDGAAAIDPRLAAGCAFLEQNFTRRIKLAAAARAANLTDDYFSRLFKKQMRTSPLQFLIRLRVQEGRRLLAAAPELTINEAARRAGFDDPKHFSRLFKRHYGSTPDEFRKQNAYL